MADRVSSVPTVSLRASALVSSRKSILQGRILSTSRRTKPHGKGPCGESDQVLLLTDLPTVRADRKHEFEDTVLMCCITANKGMSIRNDQNRMHRVEISCDRTVDTVSGRVQAQVTSVVDQSMWVNIGFKFQAHKIERQVLNATIVSRANNNNFYASHVHDHDVETIKTIYRCLAWAVQYGYRRQRPPRVSIDSHIYHRKVDTKLDMAHCLLIRSSSIMHNMFVSLQAW